MRQVEFVTGPGMLYEALQVYHSVYPDLDGVTILDPSLVYPISWTNPKFGEALSCTFHVHACGLLQTRCHTVVQLLFGRRRVSSKPYMILSIVLAKLWC